MQDNIDKRFPLDRARKYPIIMNNVPYYTFDGFILINYKVDKNVFGKGEQVFITGFSAGNDLYISTLDFEHIIGHNACNIRNIMDNCYNQMSEQGRKLRFAVLTYFSEVKIKSEVK